MWGWQRVSPCQSSHEISSCLFWLTISKMVFWNGSVKEQQQLSHKMEALSVWKLPNCLRKALCVQELQKITFCALTAAHKSKRQLQWCKACHHWTLEKCGVMNHALLSGNLMNEQKCIAQTVRFGGGGIMSWGSFSGLGLCPLIPVASRG